MHRSLSRLAVLRSTPLSLPLSTHLSRRSVARPCSRQISNSVASDLISPASAALNTFARYIQFILIGTTGLAFTTFTVFEASHIWVENVALAHPQADEETRKWEWDKGLTHTERGTDPALGWFVRHNVRAAWMMQNWASGNVAPVLAKSQSIDQSLVAAEYFLANAIHVAKTTTSKLRPGTIRDLTIRRADVLERMGSTESLLDARSAWEEIWSGLSNEEGLAATLVAKKLGDINYRLLEPEEARAWWARVIQMAHSGGSFDPAVVVPAVPNTLPKSPVAQRTILSTLVSVSGSYATTGHFTQGRQVQEASLDLARSVGLSKSLSKPAEAPETLQNLYLLHRVSLLSLHLAEVLFALKSPKDAPIHRLTNAAQISESVAITLTGIPPSNVAAEAPLSSKFTQSPVLVKPSNVLLRDARRTAAESWNLLGIVYEDTDAKKALSCYEKALDWSGVSVDPRSQNQVDVTSRRPGANTLHADWQVYTKNYARVKSSLTRSSQ